MESLPPGQCASLMLDSLSVISRSSSVDPIPYAVKLPHSPLRAAWRDKNIWLPVNLGREERNLKLNGRSLEVMTHVLECVFDKRGCLRGVVKVIAVPKSRRCRSSVRGG